jgi:hypothetical protein
MGDDEPRPSAGDGAPTVLRLFSPVHAVALLRLPWPASAALGGGTDRRGGIISTRSDETLIDLEQPTTEQNLVFQSPTMTYKREEFHTFLRFDCCG